MKRSEAISILVKHLTYVDNNCVNYHKNELTEIANDILDELQEVKNKKNSSTYKDILAIAFTFSIGWLLGLIIMEVGLFIIGKI